MDARFPTDAEVFDALRIIGRSLDRDWAYLIEATYHFTLGEDWSLAVTPESAGRLRLELWRGGAVRSTIWTRIEDRQRLAEAVDRLDTKVVALTA